MPVSKGRKKKHKSPKKTNRNTDRQVANVNGIKIVRKGNTVYTHNKRTAAEHAQFLADVKRGMPEVSGAISTKVTDAIEIFRNYDNIELLGALSINHLHNQMGKDDDGVGEIILEYGMSIASSITMADNRQFPSPKVLDTLIDTLSDLKFLYIQYYTFESLSNHQPEEQEVSGLNDLRRNAIQESINIRGVGYYDHIEEIFLGLFSLHDKFLVEKYGFTAQELITTLHELESSWAIREETPMGPHPLLIRRFSDWAMENRIFPPSPTLQNIRKFQLENPDIIIDENGFKFFRLNEIGSYFELFKIRFKNEIQKKVVNALSLKFGDNSEFIEGKNPGHILGSTKIRQTPFLKTNNDDALLFSYALPSRNFLRIGQNLIERIDPKYYGKYYLGNAYESCRDRFLERKVESIFKSLLPSVKFTPNVKYPLKGSLTGEQTELDILGESDSSIYLIEIKAGEFNEAAKRGAIDSIVSGLKKNVGKGVSQSKRALEYIEENDTPWFLNTKVNRKINVVKSKPVKRILVTLDSFAGMLTMINTLEDVAVVANEKDYPWIVHIYDLMVFAELVPGESDFIEYLDRRIPLYKWKAFRTQDELNLLGLFFENGLEFKKNVKHLDNFTLGNYLSEIDKYFYHKQVGAKPSKPMRNIINNRGQ